jgi:Zn-dependent peptidase ImmA (M78 family)
MGFDRHELKYDPHGVPYLKTTRIEEIAAELLSKHCGHILRKASPTPVMDILEQLKDRTRLQYRCADLGFVGDKKILGKVNFPTKTLHLDSSLFAERKIQFRFTAGHEIGHWVLHRYQPLRFKNKEPVQEVVDDEDSICRLESIGPGDWVERQANSFAAALVLPSVTFPDAMVRAQKEIGIVKNFGVVFVNRENYAKNDLIKLLALLADTYGVSKASVEVRLRTLKFMIDEDAKPGESVAEIMKSQLG